MKETKFYGATLPKSLQKGKMILPSSTINNSRSIAFEGATLPPPKKTLPNK